MYLYYRSTYCLRVVNARECGSVILNSRVVAFAGQREITGEPLNSRSRILAPNRREITGVDYTFLAIPPWWNFTGCWDSGENMPFIYVQYDGWCCFTADMVLARQGLCWTENQWDKMSNFLQKLTKIIENDVLCTEQMSQSSLTDETLCNLMRLPHNIPTMYTQNILCHSLQGISICIL